MKSPRLIFLSLSGLALLAGLSQFTGCAKSGESAAQSSTPAVPAAGVSQTSANISSHLELGGEFYAVLDLKGDVEDIGNLAADYADFGYKQAVMGNAKAPNLDFRALLKKLGLYNFDGLGMSSWKDADGLHHNRAYLYTPNGRTGLLKIFGDKPGPFVSPSLAPADADIAYESTIDLKSVYDLIVSYAQDVGGAAAAQAITDNLKISVPGTTLTGQSLVDHLNTRFVVIARADTKQILQPDPSFKMPMTDFLIALDGFSDVLDQLAPMLQGNPMFTIADKNGMKTVTVEMPIPDPFTVYKPQIIADPKTKRLYIVSRESFANETIFGQGARLSSSADFKAATEGLPTEGNGLSYFSKKGAAAYVEFYERQVMVQIPTDLRDKLIAFAGMDKIPHGLAATSVNQPDGIMMQYTSTRSAKDMVFIVPVAGVGLMAAMAIPAFSKVREQSRIKTIQNNLRQIAAAGQQYMLEKGVTEVRIQDLVGPGTDKYIRIIMPVAGENYDNIIIRQTTTRISVTTSDGLVVSYDL